MEDETEVQQISLTLSAGEYMVIAQVTSLGMAVMLNQQDMIKTLTSLLNDPHIGEIALGAFRKMSAKLREESADAADE